jgi:hypothetical protein
MLSCAERLCQNNALYCLPYVSFNVYVELRFPHHTRSKTRPRASELGTPTISAGPPRSYPSAAGCIALLFIDRPVSQIGHNSPGCLRTFLLLRCREDFGSQIKHRKWAWDLNSLADFEDRKVPKRYFVSKLLTKTMIMITSNNKRLTSHKSGR